MPVAKVCTHPWHFRVPPFRIYGNLYFVGNLSVCSYLLDTGDGLVLVDATFPQTVYLLVDAVYRLGFRLDDVRYHLITHAHYDHLGGARALRDLLPNATLCLGADDVPAAETRPELLETELYGTTFVEHVTIDRPLRDGDTVTLGATTIDCVHTPGHTAGTFSYFFPVTGELGTWRVGMQGGPGLATLRDDYLDRLHLPRSLRQAYLDHLARLRREQVDIHLTGHPGQSMILQRRDQLATDPRAFIDPQRWPAYLDQLEKFYHKQFSLAKPAES
jgi:metallo-beta-lactamase class B